MALVTSLTVLVAVGLSYRSEPSAVATSVEPAPVFIGASAPGSIVEISPLERVAPGVRRLSAQSLRVVYRSIDAQTGRLANVSGSVYLPRGGAPAGGWPVVAVGHRSSGIDVDCSPSTSASLLGEASRVEALLGSGYAVALSDYQGLGTTGAAHGYLDVTTSGRNVIDSVRALRGTFANVSRRWAALGTDQGGAAVWAADQQADTYAPELDLVGVVALAPMVDVSGLVDRAQDGTLTADQRTTLLWSLASLGRQHPDFDLNDYRRGVAAQQWEALTACSGPLVHDGAEAARSLADFDLSPASPEAAATLRALIGGSAIHGEALSAPLTVRYPAADGVVDSRRVAAVLRSTCRAGAVVSWRIDQESETPDATDGDHLSWLADRFAGKPANDDCLLGSVSSPGAGVVISVEKMSDVAAALPPGSSAARVVYGSTNGDTGAPTIVSGTVFAPPGSPPPGGWPVLAYGHATTGIDEGCAPSSPRLSPTLAPLATGAILRGYAVAVADYQGLGTPGVHPYLDARTAGMNIIDSVRALRATYDDISIRWAGIGTSQGAAAVWAADEQAATYAPDLDLVGAVAVAPPADVTGMVDKAAAGTLTDDQVAAFQTIVSSMGRVDPSFDVDDFRRGSAASNWAVLASCEAAMFHDRGAALLQLQMSELAPATPEAAEELRSRLQRWALPQARLSAPLSIVYGSADTLIDGQWTTDVIDRVCAQGDAVEFDEQPNKGHSDLNWISQLEWLHERFEGAPIHDDCPAP